MDASVLELPALLFASLETRSSNSQSETKVVDPRTLVKVLIDRTYSRAVEAAGMEGEGRRDQREREREMGDGRKEEITNRRVLEKNCPMQLRKID